MTLPAKGSRTITVDDVRYRWRVGHGQGPLSFAADLPCQAGTTLVVTISDCPRTRWCDDGEGLVVAPALVAAVLRLALERGWKPGVRGPQFRLAVQSSELPEAAKTVGRHFDWCCGTRVMALVRKAQSAASRTESVPSAPAGEGASSSGGLVADGPIRGLHAVAASPWPQ